MRYAVAGCVAAAALLYFASDAHAAALVAAAGVVGVLATRTWGRVPVGLALAATGLGTALSTRRPGGWAGGALLAAAGLLVTVRGRTWRGLGARYDAPVATPRTDADVWAALDRGEDPTVR